MIASRVSVRRRGSGSREPKTPDNVMAGPDTKELILRIEYDMWRMLHKNRRYLEKLRETLVKSDELASKSIEAINDSIDVLQRTDWQCRTPRLHHDSPPRHGQPTSAPKRKALKPVTVIR